MARATTAQASKSCPQTALRAHEFRQLCGDFHSFRLLYEPVYRQLCLKRKPVVFEFVRGLRFSAKLIYVIRERLEGSGMTASWGQLMDGDGYISPECDVIIHRPDGCHVEWNGRKQDRIMEYRFIQRASAAAVISCKSRLSGASRVDRDYAARLRGHVGQTWLFVECCPPQQVDAIARAANEAGYGHFWYLYEYVPDDATFTANDVGWQEFLDQVGQLRDWKQSPVPTK